jgi:hypothetical protein
LKLTFSWPTFNTLKVCSSSLLFLIGTYHLSQYLHNTNTPPMRRHVLYNTFPSFSCNKSPEKLLSNVTSVSVIDLPSFGIGSAILKSKFAFPMLSF